VKEMLEEGAFVCLGQDDISDAYYPYGHNNMLEVAFLASHLLWMTTREEIEVLYDMITTEAAKAIGLSDFRIEEGAPANLVVLDAPNTLEALRYHRAPTHVISHGALIEPARGLISIMHDSQCVAVAHQGCSIGIHFAYTARI
jgi:cytosine deaminase